LLLLLELWRLHLEKKEGRVENGRKTQRAKRALMFSVKGPMIL
jgi:hypothetical protein